MTRRIALALAATSMLCAVICFALPADAQPSSPTSPKGAEVRVELAGAPRRVTVNGELLAVDSNQVWLLVDKRATTVSRASVTGVKVRAHKYGGKRGRLIGLVGGIASGLGLAAACSTVEDAGGCVSFVAVWEGIWLLVTAISAAFMERSSWDALPLTEWSSIATHARYPQGAPPSLTAEAYVEKR